MIYCYKKMKGSIMNNLRTSICSDTGRFLVKAKYNAYVCKNFLLQTKYTEFYTVQSSIYQYLLYGSFNIFQIQLQAYLFTLRRGLKAIQSNLSITNLSITKTYAYNERMSRSRHQFFSGYVNVFITKTCLQRKDFDSPIDFVIDKFDCNNRRYQIPTQMPVNAVIRLRMKLTSISHLLTH